MRFSKLLIIVVAIAPFFFACHKNSTDVPTNAMMYPSKMYFDSTLVVDYIYIPGSHNLDRINNCDASGNIVSYNRYEYFPNGLISKMYLVFSNDTISYYDYYQYDSQGNCISDNFKLVSTDEILNTHTYEYNSQNQKIKMNYYHKNDSLVYYEKYEWEGEKLLKANYYSVVGDTLKGTIFYTQDDKYSPYTGIWKSYLNDHYNVTSLSSPNVDSTGKLTMTFYFGDSFNIISYDLYNAVYEYNSNGYPTKITRTYTSQPIRTDIYRYEYK